MGPINDLPKPSTGFDRGLKYSPPIKTAARWKKDDGSRVLSLVHDKGLRDLYQKLIPLLGPGRAPERSIRICGERKESRSERLRKIMMANEKKIIFPRGVMVCRDENRSVR